MQDDIHDATKLIKKSIDESDKRSSVLVNQTKEFKSKYGTDCKLSLEEPPALRTVAVDIERQA